MKKVTSLILLLFALAFTLTVNGQMNIYSFSSSVGSYTEITGGTLLGTTSNDDQRFVDPAVPAGGTTLIGVGFPIGFNFTFGGVVFNRIAINNNGWISLGQSSLTPSVNIASTSSYVPIGSIVAITPADLVSRIVAIGRDLQGQTGSELRIQTVGTTPNQECVIQWKGYRAYNATGDNFNFQIRLFETSNAIKFVYGTMVKNATSTTVQIGLRGAPATTATNYFNRTTTSDWSNTTAGTLATSNCTLSTTVFPASGLTFTFAPPVPCAGTPAPGNTISTPASTCPGVNFTLSLQNSTPGTGVTYQWQSSPTGADPWTNFGTSVAIATTSQIAATYYRCQVTCSGSPGISNPVLVNMNTWINCYCLPTYSSGGSTDGMTLVVLGPLSQATVGNVSPYYYDYTTTQNAIPDLSQSTSNNLFITFSTDGNQYNGVWIDFDQSGVFESDEFFTSGTNAGSGGIATVVLSIPIDATLGLTRMRIRGGNDSQLVNTQACGTSSSNYGQAQDYFVNITLPPPCIPPSGLAATSFTTTSAELSWTENGTATQWNIEYGPFGFTQGTGTPLAVSDNPYTLTGLSPATKYSFYVQADCGSGMLSTWGGPGSFTTLCEPSILPFAESFESADFAPVCWENTGWVQSLYGTAHTGAEWAYSNLAGSQLTSPEITIPSAGGYQLSFWYRAESASYPQDFDVLISTDGTTFDPVMSIVDATNTSYIEAVFKLLSYNGQNVWFRFDGLTGTGGGDWGICVDDVTVDLIPPPGFLTGIVTDANTGLPIGGAIVTADPGGHFTISMANGHYAMQLDKGTYSATYEKTDYYAETVSGIVIESSLSTNVNVALVPIPPPYCADLVSPADGETSVLPDIVLTWTPGAGTPPVLGYRIQLFNLTTGVWLEGDEFSGTDLGNVTTYTPAMPFEWANDYVWLITPYNNAGVAEGCFPWYFTITSGGNLHGIVKNEATGLPILGADVLLEQTYPPLHAGSTFNLTTAADGTWDFEGESGIYKITYSKFTYVTKTVTNVAIYANQTTNQSVLLTPVTPYPIPFVEKWNTGTTFTTQQWSLIPAGTNWSVYASSGNPAPSARFYYSPILPDYERTLQSHYINGVGLSKIYAQFDLYLSNYSTYTVESLTFMVYDGYQWHNVAVFNNQAGSIPWTQFTFDISAYAAGKQFLVGFKAAGDDSNNINWWYLDNIYITTNLMDVAPPAITDAIEKTQTSVHNVMITNPGVNPLNWTATFDVAHPWASLGSMSGTVQAGITANIPLTFDGNAVPPGVYDAVITIAGAGGLVQESVSLHLDVYELQVNPMVIFDELNTTETSVWNITLTNPGTLPYLWNAAFVAEPWFGLSETSGVLDGGGQTILTLTFDGTAVPPDSYASEILFTGAGGLLIKTVTIGLNVYDMILNPEAVYDALVVGATSTFEVNIYNPYTSPLAWIANVPSLPWLSMTPVAGTIPAGSSVTVDVTFDASVVPAGEYNSQITFDGAGGNVVKDLPVGLSVFNTPFQKIMIPEANAWGYISSYINLDGKMTLEEAMEDILDEMILMVGESGIFWPSQNINTIGSWNSNSGYKIKMGEAGLLVFLGNEVTTKIISFTKGVHLIPVLSDQPVSREDLFNGKPIEFAFGMDGSIYWPAGNIFTLNTLYPGYGYMVKFTAATTLNFTGLKGGVEPNTPAIYANKTAWNDVARTGDVHIISISSEACSELLPGDVIGVFNQADLCTGMAEYQLSEKAFAITVYADDPTTQETDGMNDNQPLSFKVFRNGVAIDLEPVYNLNMPNYDGLYAVNGLSQIKGFKVGSVGINENDQTRIAIYPNPSSGIFNIDVKGFNTELKYVVMNSQGQEIFTSGLNSSAQIDLTSQPRGVYFVKIIGNDVLKTEKLVVK